MDLGQIILKEIDFGKYYHWKQKWYNKRSQHNHSTLYASIENPLVYKSYIEAIHDFFSCQEAQGLSVFDSQSREGSKWRRLFRSDMPRPNFEAMMDGFADTAQRQPLERKGRAFFEMKFGQNYARYSKEMLVAGFTELDNGFIVSSYIDLPHDLRDWVGVRTNSTCVQFPYDQIEAAWIPE